MSDSDRAMQLLVELRQLPEARRIADRLFEAAGSDGSGTLLAAIHEAEALLALKGFDPHERRDRQGRWTHSGQSDIIGSMSVTREKPEDTAQQRVILRRSRIARAVRRKFPVGTRVVGRDSAEPRPIGIVERHVPGTDAQGGYLVVRWPNGRRGRHMAGALEKVADATSSSRAGSERKSGKYAVR